MSLQRISRLASPSNAFRQATASRRRAFSRACWSTRWSHAPQTPFTRSPQLPSRQLMFTRHESNISKAREAANNSQYTDKEGWPGLRKAGEEDPRKVPAPEADSRGEVPAYELTFTCKPCKTRSAHRISKHGYHNGTVLITCPQCKNRHVISDHLKIFNDASKSFEDILREKQQLLKTGVLDPDGDFEMWDDGTQTARDKDAQGVPVAGQSPTS